MIGILHVDGCIATCCFENSVFVVVSCNTLLDFSLFTTRYNSVQIILKHLFISLTPVFVGYKMVMYLFFEFFQNTFVVRILSKFQNFSSIFGVFLDLKVSRKRIFPHAKCKSLLAVSIQVCAH